VNYGIRNKNGEWWTGRRWGPAAKAKLYSSLNDLPHSIEDHWVHFDSCDPENPVILYFTGDRDIKAYVHRIEPAERIEA
jgi:hypothetical protein